MPVDRGALEKAAEEEAKAARKRRPKLVSEKEVPTRPDPELEAAKLLEIEQLQEDLAQAKRMFPLRVDYADKIFRLTAYWLVAVFVFVVCSSVSIPDRSSVWRVLQTVTFELPEKALIAFITTTTINVLALFLAVTGWLFPKASLPLRVKKK